ncbi:EamA family transporter [Clostridiaceae bacterium UIB06]|uniref:EamA family transporter n=1 Tax=Clostridium thailandense TaxID=2794346 RepID=A0A949WRS3_9CLOT|nr:DMT family transporter [Clostridium thailandense]MBV7274296.1 EamA family transporter [Clostridium thailandense]MCH5136196.1 EamA family transporter [Clostridiaceae bacterium UIB06]
MKKRSLGYIYVGASAFFFALIAIIGKSAFNTGMKVYDLMIMQNAVSAIIMFIYLWIKDKKSIIISRNQLKRVILQGVFGSTATTLFFYLALEKINAGIASMLIFTHPVFVTLFFVITGIRKITMVNNLALILAVVGSSMVINFLNLNVTQISSIGLMYGVICSICYAFFNVFADLKLKDVKSEVLAMYTSVIMFVVSFILNPGFFRSNITLSPQIMFYVFELAVVSGILPVIFLYKGIALVGSEKSTIIATSELPITLILAFFVLRETMVLTQIIGVAFIIGAVFVLQNEAIILEKLKKI